MKSAPALGIVIIAVVLGGAGLYFFTLPPATSSAGTTAQTTSPSSNPAPADTNKYLGYLPTSYKATQRLANSPVWPCPKGMTDTQCQTFQATCGNGVCDPNERCDTCVIDCGPTGAAVCDPYTGRQGAPATICQVVAQQH